MSVTDILTPLSIAGELIIVAIGCYAGVVQKKQAGYLFALTFLIFALYDYFNVIGFGADTLAVLNIIAVISALGGMVLLFRGS